jgi:ribosome recycling factor
MIDQLLTETHDHMRKAVVVVAQDLASIRSGRATPALVENILISAYEGTQRLRVLEMATIATQDTRTIVITPFDPSVIKDIERGIGEAGVGLNPVVDGEILRIAIPPLSEERREEYVKLARAKLEAGRVMIRQIRHEAMKTLKQKEEAGEVSEDERTTGEKKVQDATDEMIAEIDTMGARKEAELMQV